MTYLIEVRQGLSPRWALLQKKGSVSRHVRRVSWSNVSTIWSPLTYQSWMTEIIRRCCLSLKSLISHDFRSLTCSLTTVLLVSCLHLQHHYQLHLVKCYQQSFQSASMNVPQASWAVDLKEDLLHLQRTSTCSRLRLGMFVWRYLSKTSINCAVRACYCTRQWILDQNHCQSRSCHAAQHRYHHLLFRGVAFLRLYYMLYCNT